MARSHFTGKLPRVRTILVAPTAGMLAGAEEIKASQTQITARRIKRPPGRTSNVEYVRLIARIYADAIISCRDSVALTSNDASRDFGKLISRAQSASSEYGTDKLAQQRKSRDKAAIKWLWYRQIPPNKVEEFSRARGHGLDAWAKASATSRLSLDFNLSESAHPNLKFVLKLSRMPRNAIVEHADFANEAWAIYRPEIVEQLIFHLEELSKTYPGLVERQPLGKRQRSSDGTIRILHSEAQEGQRTSVPK